MVLFEFFEQLRSQIFLPDMQIVLIGASRFIMLLKGCRDNVESLRIVADDLKGSIGHVCFDAFLR